MAERTGLEPATPGVTGRYSNQLNYRSALAITQLFPGDNEGELYRPCFLCQTVFKAKAESPRIPCRG